MAEQAAAEMETGVCLHCKRPIALATFREMGCWEPDYDPGNDPKIWRQRGRNPSAGFRHLPPQKDGKQNTPKDFHEADADALLAPITLRKGFTGAKPESFCLWVLDLLNAQPGDIVDDLFPGTGVMGRVTADALNCTNHPEVTP